MALYVDIEKQLESWTLKVKFEHKEGILGFLGESGSGKSMTLKCIAGLEKPTKGKIILNDRVLFDSERNINLPTKERNIGYLFQNYALFPHMSVKDNIELGLGKLNKKEKNIISSRYIKMLCLDCLDDRYPWQLSGGQQQRVALARALATSPEIILLDEPFSALDYHLRSNMEKELINMLDEFRGDVVFVSHDISEAYRVCDDILVYNEGRARDKINKKELFESPKSLIQAKITGCKNISSAYKISEKKIFATDWGIELESDNKIEDNIKYVGIRNHNIYITDKENSDGCFNIIRLVENPFTYSVYLKSKNTINENFIEIEIDKKELQYKVNDSIYIGFDKIGLFTFN